jgi:hypothetical protein
MCIKQRLTEHALCLDEGTRIVVLGVAVLLQKIFSQNTIDFQVHFLVLVVAAAAAAVVVVVVVVIFW